MLGGVRSIKGEKQMIYKNITFKAAPFSYDAMERGERIELTSKYFSKKLLYALYEEGAFAPNKYNRYDGTNDYQFMLDMFNKRNKSEITEQQHRKILWWKSSGKDAGISIDTPYDLFCQNRR